jgi:hypothetical protein
LHVNTIYYENPEDIEAYTARRLMDRKSYGKATIEKPNISKFGSDQFCLNRL